MIPPEPDARTARLQETISDLIQVSHRMARLAAHVSGSTESPASWRTLSVLQAYGPMRLGELAERSRVSQPTMTKLVRGLVDRGRARRLADSDDARAWQIGITADGDEALEGWRHTIGTALAPLFADITDEELRTLQEGVRIVSAGERRADGIDLLGSAKGSATPPRGASPAAPAAGGAL
ncbi:MAG TPA: MarR family transcriptional regulator [Microbacteriaceae bacterium]|nr:MarR family transcriptional regulator [Microbacteriaceae bacterium]